MSKFQFTKNEKHLLAAASLLALLAVAFGAFGAHGLNELLTKAQAAAYETAVRYQFYHSFAIFITLFLNRSASSSIFIAAARCFLVGTVLFSGSIYLLSLSGFTNLPTDLLGPLTPIGGVFMLLGWLLVLIGVIRK